MSYYYDVTCLKFTLIEVRVTFPKRNPGDEKVYEVYACMFDVPVVHHNKKILGFLKPLKSYRESEFEILFGFDINKYYSNHYVELVK